jgi:NAD(P)-dependent dehydrogenase (short-subunit alcohol dehydrogenase family)
MKGKVVVVSGAFGILGGAVAEAAAQAGAQVVALDVAPAAPEGLAERLGPDALLIGGIDLSSPETARKIMADIKARFGRLDALLNIAGGFRWETVESGDAATWDHLYAMNVKTTLNAAKAAIPYLLESGAGRIVNLGAAAALKSAVLPSIIDTPANRADMPEAAFDRWVAPRDLAAIILFLASDAAKAITGALIPVTGGV